MQVEQFNNLVFKDIYEDSLINRIPNELWDMICSHINLIDYHNLRLSTKYISLPHIQVVTWESYLDSLNSINNFSILNSNLLLNTEYMCGDRVLQLFEMEQYNLVKHALIQYNPSISQDCVRQLLWNSVFKGLADLTMRILKDQTLEINNVDYLDVVVNQLGYFDNYIGEKNIKSGHLESMTLLLRDQRFKPSNYSNIARWTMYWSCSMGNEIVIESLLSCGRIDTSIIDNDCFVEAARRGHATLIDTLLSVPSIDPIAMEYRALSLASIYGHYDVVYRLLDDPRVKSQENLRLAALYAIRKNHWSTFFLLSGSLTTKNFIHVVKTSDTIQYYGKISSILVLTGLFTIEYVHSSISTSLLSIGIIIGLPCAACGLIYNMLANTMKLPF
ncbi:hypothetical protein BC833DRAFT_611385 [Globomyces pollinis-pini]|nr:hypothetical protein BC833DRAFT_611385 [Globomyces pollinis-pini]